MSNTTNGMLKSFVERLARLEDQKQEIADDIKSVKTEAAGEGFDKKVLTRMVKEYRMDASERAAEREFETICELYRASLGMLDGTPLGESARQRAAEPPKAKPEESPDDDKTPGRATTEATAEPEEGSPEFPVEDLAAARERGREDAKSGVKIIANPYTAGDPRRAAWDESWCAETGNDGMEIPEYLRRKASSKKANEKGEGK